MLSLAYEASLISTTIKARFANLGMMKGFVLQALLKVLSLEYEASLTSTTIKARFAHR